MKKKILMASGISSAVATLCGIVAIFAQNPQPFGLAACFGLWGVALFFVGLAYPRD